MNKQSSSKDTLDIEGYDQLKAQYRAISQEMPDTDIDKQIIAAAHRELANPNAKKVPKNSWLRRLSLPLYAAATFTFTALATHWFWPEEPAKTLPGTAPTPVSFDVMEPQIKVETRQKRTPRELPEPPVILQQPKVNTSNDNLHDAVNVIVEDISQSSAESSSQSADYQQTAQQANKVAKVVYPDKEDWTRDIIQLLKKGEDEAARKELIRFKKIYPNYPIDEQLKILLQ